MSSAPEVRAGINIHVDDGCAIAIYHNTNTFTLVPHVRIRKLHCYCKHCTLYWLGLGLRLGNYNYYSHTCYYMTPYMRKLPTFMYMYNHMSRAVCIQLFSAIIVSCGSSCKILKVDIIILIFTNK